MYIYKKPCNILIFLALVILLPLNGMAGSGWQKILVDDGITVYTRPVEGCSLDEFKGVTVVQAPMHTCLAVLRDVPSQPQWMGDCVDAKVLKTFNKNHIVAYNVIQLPWPLSKRDLQVDTRFTIEDDRVVVAMSVYPEIIEPVTEKYVRITDFEATCILKKTGEDSTSVTYINRVNPMAPVPAAIATRFLKKNPVTTLRGFKRMVLHERYR
ncbi:MAG: START domain-containing protein [Spirochaetota bacterium]